MPSPGEDIQSWSVTAGNNGVADPLIVWSEGQARASVNNSARGMMAAHAKNRNLLNGSIVTTGSANVQAFLSGLTYTTIPTNLVVRLKIGSGLTNDSSATLNMDGLGAVSVKTADGSDLLGGELVANGYADFVYNGTNWIFLYSQQFIQNQLTSGGGIIIGHRVFDVAGTSTYAPTAGMECCIIECIGGGGGGGSVPGGTTSSVYTAPGGGSGGYSRKIATAADIGASQTVTVGAGGAAASDGGASSLGTLCVANGGKGASSAAGTSGAAGAAPGTGDIAAAGAPGEHGVYAPNALGGNTYMWSGAGGSSALGGGAVTPNDVGAVAGNPAGKYGSGGSGAFGYLTTSSATGGAGSSGVVIITEFSGRGAPGRDGATGPVGPAGPAGAGTGDVLVSGIPASGQIAQWTDTSHITGIDASALGAGAFSTGDAKITLKTVADSGWVLMDDGTIGSATSGASTRANGDTQALFTLLFNNINDTNAPILTSAGAATTRAAQTNAATAWAANCRMTLVKVLGRSLAVAGAGSGLTSRTLGVTAGAETETPTISKTAAHAHTAGSSEGVTTGASSTHRIADSFGNVTSTVGSGTPLNIIDPTTYWNVMIKL